MSVWYPDRLALGVIGDMPEKFWHDGLAVNSAILHGQVGVYWWLLRGFDLDHFGAPFPRLCRFVASIAEALCVSGHPDKQQSANCIL